MSFRPSSFLLGRCWCLLLTALNSKGPEVMTLPLTREETEAPGGFGPLSSGHTGGQWPVKPHLGIMLRKGGLSSLSWTEGRRVGGATYLWPEMDLSLLGLSSSTETVLVINLFLSVDITVSCCILVAKNCMQRRSWGWGEGEHRDLSSLRKQDQAGLPGGR